MGDFAFSDIFDAVIIAVILISAVLAFARGFIKTVFSLLCWGFSLSCALLLGPYLVKTLEDKIDNFYLVLVIAYLGGFAIVFFLFAIIFSFIVRLAQPVTDGFVDRALGAALGLFRGTVIACLMFAGIQSTFAKFEPQSRADAQREEEEGAEAASAPKGPQWLVEAQTYNFLHLTSELFGEMLPDKLVAWAENRADGLFARVVKDTLPEGVPGQKKTRNPSGVNADIALAPQHGQTLDAIVRVLPEESLNLIDEEYGHVSRKMLTPEEKLDFYARVIDVYNQDLFEGEIMTDMKVPESDVLMMKNEITRLRQQLYEISAKQKGGNASAPGAGQPAAKEPADPDDPYAGYRKEQLNMMQRLVDQIQ